MAKKPSDRVSFKVGGDLSGQVVIGDHNRTISVREQVADPVKAADLAELASLIDQVRARVREQEDAVAEAGLAQLDELESAITDLDLAAVEEVQGWFRRRIPWLADLIGRIILSPVIAKIVTAAGDDLSAEFRRRFG